MQSAFGRHGPRRYLAQLKRDSLGCLIKMPDGVIWRLRMRPRHAILLATSLLFALPASTGAFDAEREGKIFALGLGAGWTRYVHPGGELGLLGGVGREDFVGGSVMLRMGFAPSEQMAVYYIEDTLFHEGIDGGAFYTGFQGLGVTWYQELEAPGLYWTFAAGRTSYEDLNGQGEGIGYGFRGGAGYELARGWSVELDYTWGTAGSMKTRHVEEADSTSYVTDDFDIAYRDVQMASLKLVYTWY